MRRIIPYVLILLVAISLRCNKESSTPDNVSLLDVVTITDQAGVKFLEFAAQTGGDPYQALLLTRDWVASQEGVTGAIVTDSAYIRIKLESGLLTDFYFDETDENGISVYRGSGAQGSGKLTAFVNSGDCSNEIKNKNVLIFASAFDEFYSKDPEYLDYIARIFTDADETFTVTILKNDECTYEMIETFKNYGMIIIDTHGAQDGFLLGYKIVLDPKPANEEDIRSLVIAQAGEDVLQMMLEGKLGYSDGFRMNPGLPNWYLETKEEIRPSIWVRSSYINSRESWPETVILGNMCYSGANKVNNPEYYDKPLIRQAFINRNLISYYGYCTDIEYSGSVSDKLCKMMEDSLSRALVVDGDSTGVAHLKGNATEFNDVFFDKKIKFKHYNSKNYCYGFCGKDLVDKRDGKIYKTVCIGNQVWMADNLDYEVVGSACYEFLEVNCADYGQLYTWDMVMNGESSSGGTPSGVRGICPEGWHVPSTTEWQNLIVALGGDPLAGGALKAVEGWQSPNTGADNSSGFSALPGGSAAWLYSGFVEKGRQASFWTATEVTAATDQAMQRTLYYNTEEVNRISRNKNDGLSLRCVKD